MNIFNFKITDDYRYYKALSKTCKVTKKNQLKKLSHLSIILESNSIELYLSSVLFLKPITYYRLSNQLVIVVSSSNNSQIFLTILNLNYINLQATLLLIIIVVTRQGGKTPKKNVLYIYCISQKKQLGEQLFLRTLSFNYLECRLRIYYM